MRPILLAFSLILLSACSPRYSAEPLGQGHQANPSAPVAAEPVHRRTLEPSGAEASKETPAMSTGRQLQTKTEKAGTPPVPTIYACPMHPEVTSDKPHQRCPKCNMELVKKDAAQPPGDHQ